METSKVMTNTQKSKRQPSRRLISAREHNTMDNGQPPKNDDGTRTYKLIERVSTLHGDGAVSAHDEGVYLHCPECHCARGDDGVIIVDDMAVSCHCPCHEQHGENSTYSGHRSLKSCEVTGNNTALDYRQDVWRDFIARDWGPRSTKSARMRLSVDLCCDVLGGPPKSELIYELVAESFLSKLVVDEWEISAEELRRVVEILEESVVVGAGK